MEGFLEACGTSTFPHFELKRKTNVNNSSFLLNP